MYAFAVRCRVMAPTLALWASILLGAPHPARGADWPAPQWTPVDAQAWPGADAVVLLDSARVLFEKRATRGYWIDRRVRLHVLTPAGRSRADLSIPLDHTTRIESLRARSFGVEGSDVQTVRRDAVVRGPDRLDLGPGAERHQRAAVVVPAVDVGDIVEYHYTLYVRGARPVPDWVFGGPDPVIESVFAVQRRDDLPLGWSFSEGGQVQRFDPQTVTRDGSSLLEWRRTDRPPAPTLDGEPDTTGAPRLRLVLVTDPALGTWPRVAQTIRAALDDRGALPEATLTALTAGLTGQAPEQQARALFDRITTRWLPSPHLGEPPQLADRRLSAIAAASSAEPEELVAVYVAAGRALGLEVWPAAVASARRGPIDEQLPTGAAFDHLLAAVRIGEHWLFVDPNDRESAPGEVGPQLAGRGALLVGPDTHTWQTLPPPAESRLTMRWSLADDGRFTLTATAAGHQARPWRRAQASLDDLDARVRGTLLGGVPPAAIESIRIEPAAAHAVTIEVAGRWPGMWIPLADGATGFALRSFVPAAQADGAYRQEVHVDLPWPARARLPDLTLPARGDAAETLTGALEAGHLRLVHTAEIGARAGSTPDLAGRARLVIRAGR